MSERPTQNEIDEANSSHAQEVEEQEVLRRNTCDHGREVGFCSTCIRISANPHYSLYEALENASKLRKKDAATISFQDDFMAEAARQIGENQATISQLKEENQHTKTDSIIVIETLKAELSASQEQVKTLREAFIEYMGDQDAERSLSLTQKETKQP